MRRKLTTSVVAMMSALGLAVGVSTTADAATGAQPHGQQVCSIAKAGEAACMAVVLVDAAGRHVTPDVQGMRAATAKPTAISGKKPVDIQSAYKLKGLSSSGRTVAIVDAYGYPNAERDLGVYRAQWGLPACTKANGCLTIVNQTGGKTLPAFDLGWAGEQALDLDAVSATCPSCKILLVQATTPSFSNLGTAVNTAAATKGVVAISNSYGAGDASDATYGRYYNHPGIAVTASTGDNGYQGASFPASSHYVTAVGGTTLTTAKNSRGWTESVWKGSGSGCSTLNTAPAGQTTAMTKCKGRAMADVAAVADPATGLAVYAPTSKTGSSWGQYGGTSLSAPIIAAVYALSGNTTGYANTKPYARPSGLFDVTSGTNGSNANWSKAKTGWDGATGLGTPNGTSAF